MHLFKYTSLFLLLTVFVTHAPLSDAGKKKGHHGFNNYDILISGLVAKMLQQHHSGGGGGDGGGGFHPVYIPIPYGK